MSQRLLRWRQILLFSDRIYEYCPVLRSQTTTVTPLPTFSARPLQLSSLSHGAVLRTLASNLWLSLGTSHRCWGRLCFWCTLSKFRWPAFRFQWRTFWDRVNGVYGIWKETLSQKRAGSHRNSRIQVGQVRVVRYQFGWRYFPTRLKRILKTFCLIPAR